MSPDALKRLSAAGLSIDQIAVVMEVLVEEADKAEDVLEASRAKTRARVQKWRASKAGNVTEQTETLRNGSRESVTRVEVKPLPQREESKEERQKDAPVGDASAFRAALSPFLDTERLDALVKHRRTKRAQVSGHAANLFITAADKAGLSLPDAVDVCIERGWLTVNADWLAPRGRAGPALMKPMSLAGAFGLIAQAERDRRDQDNPRTDEPAVLYLPSADARGRN